MREKGKANKERGGDRSLVAAMVGTVGIGGIGLIFLG